MRVVFAVPTIKRPHPAMLAALEACLPAVEAAGWEHQVVHSIGCPYISFARADMARKAIDARADVVFFLDHDVSFRPEDVAKVLSVEEPVVAGTYRFKKDEEEYMGALLPAPSGRPIVGPGGCLKADRAPAGFLKVTREALAQFARAYPQLLCGDPLAPHVDLFNHGAIDGVWHGEDYAFCKRWIATGADLWIAPDLYINHHSEDRVYEGNLHWYLCNQEGGKL